MPLVILLASDTTHAIDTIPGQAIAPPPDVNAFMLSYTAIQLGDKYSDGKKTSLNTQLNFDGILVRYTRTFTLNNQPAAVYIQPSWLHVKPSQSLSSFDDEYGLGDTASAFAYWFYADHQTGRYFATASYLIAPTGDYNSNQLINLGLNRWSFAQQIAYQTKLSDHWDIMVSADVQWFEENNDYRLTHQKYQQKLLFSTQATLMFNIEPTLVFAGSYYFHKGGESKLEGVSQHDSIERHRYGLALIKKSRQSRLILQYGEDIKTKNGFIEEHQAFIRWQTFWN
ncbi:transporter [Zooshikella marina]|uniref:transporter n=1 Tax=Zooshikella ganghwensis TaxID=202772 RepID=UPI001BAF850E|nr:transporter [Zooshikella ganghwensis]MBU2708454.1 transporter [Zooshikella ganghwensis]